MNSDVDIRTLPISEWRFSVWHICLRYRNNRCRCRMSDIADIKGIVVWNLPRVILYIFPFVFSYTIIALKLFATIIRLCESINDLQFLLTVQSYEKLTTCYLLCKQRVVNNLYLPLSALLFCTGRIVTTSCECRFILADFSFELSTRS
jgi:hypothetical protein